MQKYFREHELGWIIVCHCFIVLFMFLYNIVSGQLALLLLINDWLNLVVEFYVPFDMGRFGDDPESTSKIAKSYRVCSLFFTSILYVLSVIKLVCSFWRTLVVDPSSTAYYRWLAVISVAVLYNLLVIIARSVFWQLRERGVIVWFLLDYSCDLIYLVDMFVQLRTGLLLLYVYVQWCCTYFMKKNEQSESTDLILKRAKV